MKNQRARELVSFLWSKLYIFFCLFLFYFCRSSALKLSLFRFDSNEMRWVEEMYIITLPAMNCLNEYDVWCLMLDGLERLRGDDILNLITFKIQFRVNIKKYKNNKQTTSIVASRVGRTEFFLCYLIRVIMHIHSRVLRAICTFFFFYQFYDFFSSTHTPSLYIHHSSSIASTSIRSSFGIKVFSFYCCGFFLF